MIDRGLITPSGELLSPKDNNLIAMMHEHGCVRFFEEPVRLKSGIFSHFYVSTRNEITDHPDLGLMIGGKIAQVVTGYTRKTQPGNTACLIGIPSAGTNLAAAAAYAALHNDTYCRICYRVIRPRRKKYGIHKTWIDGKPNPNHFYFLVENVATTGTSVINAQKKMIADGYPGNTPCIILVDRNPNGKTASRLQEKSITPIPIFSLVNIAAALHQKGIWAEEILATAMTEARNH